MTRPFNSRIRFNAIKSTLFASHCGHKRQVRGGLLRVLYPISRYAKPYAKVYRSWLFDTVLGRKCFSAIRRDVRRGLREGENRFVGGWIKNWLEKFIIIRRASACCRIKRFSRNHDLSSSLSFRHPRLSFLFAAILRTSNSLLLRSIVRLIRLQIHRDVFQTSSLSFTRCTVKTGLQTLHVGTFSFFETLRKTMRSDVFGRRNEFVIKLTSLLFLTSTLVTNKWQYLALRPALSATKLKDKTIVSLQLNSIP